MDVKIFKRKHPSYWQMYWRIDDKTYCEPTNTTNKRKAQMISKKKE